MAAGMPGGMWKGVVAGFVLILVMITLVLWHVEEHGGLHVRLPSAFEAIALMLAAATLVLTAVALGVALFAFIGYREIIGKAEKVALEEAARATREMVEPLAARYVRAYLDKKPIGDAGAEAGGEELEPLSKALTRSDDNGDSQTSNR